MSNNLNNFCWGGKSAFALANGMSAAADFYTDPVEVQNADNITAELISLAETPVAMLMVPSATTLPSPMGIIYVAQAAGTSSVTITHATPAGTQTTVTVSGNDITVKPAVGAMNEQTAMLVNQNAAASALVIAYTFGWGPNGPVLSSFNEDIVNPARVDLVAAMAKTSLANSSATAAQAGTATFQGSADLLNWYPLGNPVTVGGPTSTPPTSTVTASGDQHVRLFFDADGGSVGQLSGFVVGKGGAR
jgi:hypothetical protein